MSSIPHRLDNVDYQARRIYHITMTTEGRRPLLGTLIGDPTQPNGHPTGPAVLPTPLGHEVLRCLLAIPHYHPHVRLLAHQLMPDHLHFILFVTHSHGPHLGRIIQGFKIGCNRAYRQFFPQGAGAAVGEAAVGEAAVGEAAILSQPQQPQPQPQPPQPPRRPTTEERKHGQLWSTSYYETPLSGRNQLDHMVAYVHDNPRRALLKRQHAALFHPTSLTAAGIPFAAVGNAALLSAPRRHAVRISRRTDAATLQALLTQLLEEALGGTILLSPFISPGEKQVHEALLAERLPHIRLDGEGFGPYYKPSGPECELVAQGQLLILAPWPWQSRRPRLGKAQFEALNTMAARLAAP